MQSGKGQAKGVASMSGHILCKGFTKRPELSFLVSHGTSQGSFQHLWPEVSSVWLGMWRKDLRAEKGSWDPAVPVSVGLPPGRMFPAWKKPVPFLKPNAFLRVKLTIARYLDVFVWHCDLSS